LADKDYVLTKHAETRLKQRNISEQEIIEVMRNPDYSFTGKNGEIKLEKKFKEGRKIRVVYIEERGRKKIITAMIYD